MLNALPFDDRDRVNALNELFPKLDLFAVHHISYLRWTRRTQLGPTATKNGSCFFSRFLRTLVPNYRRACF